MAKQVEVRDSSGFFCGYLAEKQLLAIGEEYRREGDVLRLWSISTPQSRRTMLEMSMQGGGLTPKQNTKVTAQLLLLGENDSRIQTSKTSFKNLGDASGGQVKRPAIASNDSLERLYIARDYNGFYLGLYPVSLAKNIWFDTLCLGGIILVRRRLSYRKSCGVRNPLISQIDHYSERTMACIGKAAAYSSSLDQQKDLRGFWKSRQPYSYNVFGTEDEPLCCVPYDTMSAFGDGWIVTGEDSIQLVANWDPSEVSKRVELAVSSAKSVYETIAPAGKRSLRTSGKSLITNNNASDNPLHETSQNDLPKTQDDRPSRQKQNVANPVAREKITDQVSFLLRKLDTQASHADIIMNAMSQLEKLGRKARLLKLLKSAYENNYAELPSGTTKNVALIPELMLEEPLSDLDVTSIIMTIDQALTAKDDADKTHKQVKANQLADAKRHEHKAFAWAESVLAGNNAAVSERELASAITEGIAPVLVMPDGDLYHRVLNTDMTDSQYASALDYMPFTHFVVSVPGLTGVYGFGVVADADGANPTIVHVLEESSCVEPTEMLDKYFKRLLFFICANREGLGLEPTIKPNGQTEGAQASYDTSIPETHAADKRKKENAGTVDDVIRGQVFRLGTRIVYLSESSTSKDSNRPGRDIRPHAVAGSVQMRNGKQVRIRPHWNHGSGSKRNELPREIVERNIRLS